MKPTYIVSGHPRTGTSTMMRFLHGGGLPIIADKKYRKSNNRFEPYGSFEIADVGPTLQRSKPEDTAGRAVKLVAPYIHFLPMDRPLKVVFMTRDINEIITSLVAMRVVWGHNPVDTIAAARRFITEAGIPMQEIKYDMMVKYPKTVAVMVSSFLGLEEFNIDGAIAAVDPNARRNDPGEIVRFDFNKIMNEKELR